MLKYLALTMFVFFSLIFIFSGCSASYNRGQYIGILKSYSAYNNANTSKIPNFYYDDSSDSNLIRLRKEYDLDKIAGNGTEISKMINLMNWVHNSIKYDGSSINPNPRNTFNIMKVCKEEDRGVNCRMLATVLNEVYLAMGFKSRFVTCMPEKVNFQDCHVINIVYSNTYKKWIYMDPTWDTYFTDGKGNYLDIEEVRERVINNEQLNVNKEMNINFGNFFSNLINIFEGNNKSSYLDYMSKNLFRFRCLTKSEFNGESLKNSDYTYIELVPVGYMPDKKVKADTLENGHLSTCYYTNNSKKFWAIPK